MTDPSHPPPPTGPFVAWYEAWRAEHGRRAVAEAAARAEMDREIRWMARMIVAWALVVTGATAVVVWRLLPT